jgi:hypothetical protein
MLAPPVGELSYSPGSAGFCVDNSTFTERHAFAETPRLGKTAARLPLWDTFRPGWLAGATLPADFAVHQTAFR